MEPSTRRADSPVKTSPQRLINYNVNLLLVPSFFLSFLLPLVQLTATVRQQDPELRNNITSSTL